MMTLTNNSALTIHEYRVRKHPHLSVFVRDDGFVLRKMKRWSSIKDLWFAGTTDVLSGYRVVRIGPENYSVHRLVAETYIDNKENKLTVDHINRDRSDNRVQNLRWATHTEQASNRGTSNAESVWVLNRAKRLAIQRKTYANNRDKRVQECKLYRETHKEQQREYTKKYYAAHKEQVNESNRKYKETHKEHIKEYNRLYREMHKEQLRDYNKKYYATHKEH